MIPRIASLVLVLAVSCGDGKGGSTDGTTGGDTSGSTTNATTSGPATTGSGATSTGSTDATTGSGATSTGSTDATTGGASQFERFTLRSAAGPCAPGSDCNGFVELLATGLLRVEKFGDVGDPVIEVQVSEDDLAGAVEVFTDPELVALLDGPEPLCDPPTDIFESMELVLAGQPHDATTTTCDQPPLAAARATADALRTKYVP